MSEGERDFRISPGALAWEPNERLAHLEPFGICAQPVIVGARMDEMLEMGEVWDIWRMPGAHKCIGRIYRSADVRRHITLAVGTGYVDSHAALAFPHPRCSRMNCRDMTRYMETLIGGAVTNRSPHRSHHRCARGSSGETPAMTAMTPGLLERAIIPFWSSRSSAASGLHPRY